MGKADKKKKNDDGLELNATSKFTVLDAPGIVQKPPEAPAPAAAAGAGATATKDGLQGRRATTSGGPLMGGDKEASLTTTRIGGDSFVQRKANPEWIQRRLQLYEELAVKRRIELESKVKKDIDIVLPDGKKVAGQAWKTTPLEVALGISQGLADAACVARVLYESYVEDYNSADDGMEADDGMGEALAELKEEEEETSSSSSRALLWDMTRPLVGNVQRLEFVTFDSESMDTRDAKTVFWHSSAHVLGEALEHLFGCRLTIGPPLAGGFYYDSYMGTQDALTEDDYKAVEAEVSKITKQKQPFERLVVSKEEALELFAGNPFKEQIIRTKVPPGTRTSVYRCGDLIDLCRGPHLPHTGRIKAFCATRHSATQWLGDTDNDSLQRMYGISFPDKKMLKVWKENLEKAKERDHRRIAQKQELVMFHELSAGSAFWLPHGARIYNKLIDFIKGHYWKRGYHEVITPNIFNLDLWHRSGHALHYKDAMFCFDVEGQEWAMKPMNCPGHCLMFGNSIRSYRDLPLRLADFGVLHRNELSGALTGLTRVRRFQQDDAHIFCRRDQIEQEVLGALEFMKDVYDTFGMTYKLELSTRPKKALGDVALWDEAEAALARAMNAFGGEGSWRVNPGDGAFYGPKIDIKVMDAMDRIHQCATVQLDFQLPIRFDLQYNTGGTSSEETFARPVMVHRAMLGSVERMFAVLCEHYGGKWPFWLSPRQAMVIPIHADWNDYCQAAQQLLHEAGFYVDVDLSKARFDKKVRTAQVAQYNFQLVVGEAEVKNGSVNLRTRDNQVKGEVALDKVVRMFQELRDEFQ